MKHDFDRRTILITALSLSIGWGIRGNYGHEIGAMIPGVLAAMAVVLTIDRPDWHRRIAYFGMFGAIGGAGTALPAVLSRDRLTEFFTPLIAVFAVWMAQGKVESWLEPANSDFRQEGLLY